MKQIKNLLIAISIFAFACAAPKNISSVKQEKKIDSVDLVITNISVIPMDNDTTLLNQTIWINDGKIIGFGKNTSLIAKKTIDGTGKYLMPGLADMHVHLPDFVIPVRTGTDGQAGLPDYNPDSVQQLNRYFSLNLAAGVTTLRSMRGKPGHIALAKKIAAGEIVAPTIHCSAPAISSKSEVKLEQIDSLVASYKNEGYELLKILSIKDTTYFNQFVASAKKYDIKLAGHAPRNVSFDALLDAEYSSIEHLGGYLAAVYKGGAVLKRAVNKTIEKGIYNCATLDWYNIGYLQVPLESLKKRHGLQYMSAEKNKAWEDEMAASFEKTDDGRKTDYQTAMAYKFLILKALDAGGAKLLLSPDATGSFAVPGFSMWEEMKLYKRAGLSNYSILKAATVNAAAYFGEANTWGTLTNNKRADMVLLKKNPLENIENIATVEGVFLNGKYFSQEVLVKMK